MLQCCHSIFYILNGRGSTGAAKFRHCISTSRFALLDRSISSSKRCIASSCLQQFTTRHFNAQADDNSRDLDTKHTSRPLVRGISIDVQGANAIGKHLLRLEPAPVKAEPIALHISQTAPSKTVSLCKRRSIDSGLRQTKACGTSDPISTLRQQLSPLRQSGTRDIAGVVSAYEQASAKSMLTSLDAQQFSNLISLLGSLSLSTDEIAPAYRSPLAVEYRTSTTIPDLWSLLLKIAEDKRLAGHKLDSQDRYWIMMAWLAGKGTAKVAVPETLRRLRVHYESLKIVTDDPNVHVPYLKFLLATGNPKHMRAAVDALCEVLQRVPGPAIMFHQLLCEVILSRAEALNPEMKERVLQAVSERIASRHTVERSVTPTSLTRGTHTGVIDASDPSRDLAGPLSLCYASDVKADSLRQVAVAQIQRAVDPSLSLAIRWNHLVLLAPLIFQEIGTPSYVRSAAAPRDTESTLTTIALTMRGLERHVEQTGPQFAFLLDTVQGIGKLLWHMFCSIEHKKHPIDEILGYSSMFFRVAALTFNENLREECFRFSHGLRLWEHLDTGMRAQVVENIAAYAKAFVACEGYDWPKLYSSISSSIPDARWQVEVTERLLQYYTTVNVSIAYDLYVHCVEAGIDISSSPLDGLLMTLVKNERWDIATIFLKHPSTSPNHIELLFGESIRLFHLQKYETVDPVFVKLLAESAISLYKDRPLRSSLKEAFRYFLSLMIRMGHASGLVRFVQEIYQASPPSFSQNVIEGLLLQLVRRQELSVALDLFCFFEQARRNSSLNAVRYTLFFLFMKAGAHNLAKQLSGGRGASTTSLRQDGASRIPWSRRLPTISQYFHPDLLDRENFSANARDTVSLLVHVRHYNAATKLYVRYHSELDTATSTIIGNIILSGVVKAGQFRQGRLVRQLLRTKDQLSKQCGFLPDRTTLNIIIKAILKWSSAFPAKRVRKLFDALVHEGYPVAEQFRRANGVPFGSPPSSSEGLDIPLPRHMSFTKHVQPMYRMFITAFYVRGDIAAAKTVVGILKEAGVRDMEEREKRNRARALGRMKKKLKETQAGSNR